MLQIRTALGVGFARLLALISLAVVSSVQAHTPPFPDVESPLAEPRLESVGVGVIPRYVVPTIAQDRAGFLWIATGDGLVRFDGYRFRPQERESPDPAARNLGWIRALLAGRDGRLWIGTEWDGLAVYDPANERVSSCHGDIDKNGGALPTIRALVEDSSGGIWAGSEGEGWIASIRAAAAFPTTGIRVNPAACPTIACRRC